MTQDHDHARLLTQQFMMIRRAFCRADARPDMCRFVVSGNDDAKHVVLSVRISGVRTARTRLPKGTAMAIPSESEDLPAPRRNVGKRTLGSTAEDRTIPGRRRAPGVNGHAENNAASWSASRVQRESRIRKERHRMAQ